MYTLAMPDREDWGYVAIWEFHPRPGQERAFAYAYGPDGPWVQLFRKADGYLGTKLMRDLNNPRRFLTLDYWQSRSAYEAFRAQNISEYESIDRQCEGLNEKELPIGSFERVSS
jgi:heme-degrading monooxygenase HmoA